MMYRSTPGIRTSLSMLVIVCIIPVATMAILLIVNFYNAEHERLARDAISRARAITSAVDRDIAVTQAALLGLSTAPALGADDLRGFHEQALSTVQVLHADSIVLVDPRGQLLLATSRPYGQALPRLAQTPLWKQMMASGQPGVSDLFVGPVVGHLIYTVGVPIRRAGAMVYSLNATVPPQQLARVMAEQKLPATWRAVITDTAGQIVVRSHENEKYFGKKVVPELLRRMALAAEGTFRNKTHDGIDVVTAYSRSPVTGWTVAIGVPTVELTLPLRQTLGSMVVASVAALVVGLLLAWFVGGRISRSVKALIKPALALGFGELPRFPRMYLKEANAVGLALISAANTLQRSQHAAQHDALTGMPNRTLFRAAAEQHLALCQRNETALSVLFLDLDGFKSINDTLGHPAGDQLLRQVAARITGVVRESDLVARFGGDEFAIALMHSDLQQANMFGTRLIELISQPYQLGAVETRISASIGVAGYRISGTDIDTMLKQADLALYRAKALGKQRVCLATA